MQKTFVNVFALTTMPFPSRLWGPTWIPVLPNLANILTVFAVSFTIGWGVHFLSLARRQNSPRYTLMIHMSSLMAGWAILAAWTNTLCSRCKRCCMNVTPTPASTKRPWNDSKAGLWAKSSFVEWPPHWFAALQCANYWRNWRIDGWGRCGWSKRTRHCHSFD